MYLGSSTTAKHEHPLPHPAFWGGQVPCAPPAGSSKANPPLPWIEMNHNSQQPEGQQPSNIDGSPASKPYGTWSPRHPRLTSFPAKECGKPGSPRLCKTPKCMILSAQDSFLRGCSTLSSIEEAGFLKGDE